MKKNERPGSVLITGASSGIGAALAKYYSKPGITLYLSGRDADRLATTRRACQKLGATVNIKIIDVCNRFDMATWVEQSHQQNPLDLIIANAGISGGPAPLSGEDDSTRDIFATNLAGVLNTVLPAVPLMTERGLGQIAIMSSLAGFRGLASAPAYSASKAAVKAWGEGLRGQLSGTGVRINVICPGFVESSITDANNFAMPFLMKADKAAKIIAKGLRRNSPRIAFPFPMHAAIWLLSILPPGLVDPILARLPKKS
jgi:short-subunit dehydrogenase